MYKGSQFKSWIRMSEILKKLRSWGLAEEYLNERHASQIKIKAESTTNCQYQTENKTLENGKQSQGTITLRKQ